MTARSVLLPGAPGGVRRVSVRHLLADPSTRLLDGAPAGLSRAPARARPGWATAGAGRSCGSASRTCRRCGRATGAAAPSWRLPGEPRPEYAPGSRSWSAMPPRPPRWASGCRPCADGSGGSRQHGPAGLADDRGQRRKEPLAGADPRWLDMARRVLAERTEASKPTQDLVLAEVAARLDAEHGDGGGAGPEADPRPRRCCGRSPGARPRSAGRRPSGRSPAARRRPTGGCGRRGRASTCCWTPPGWTCSRWTR